MAKKINIDLKKLPPYAKIVISIVPALIVSVVVIVLLILPRNKEIKALEIKISAQDNEIAKSQSKAEKLPQITAENERLKNRLGQLKEQLPEEKEVSGLLKQVSDLAIRSGLQVLLWRPEQKKLHSSGIVYEIPVKVELSGGYHSLGYFFSSLTRLNRIVNISDIRLGESTPDKEGVKLKISFTATTFSAVPEEDIGKETGKGK